MTHSEIVSFLWGVADLLRDDFRRSKYQDVILPLTVLRRIDCVLADTKQAVLKRNAQIKGKLDNPDDLLRKTSGYAFYSTSLYDFEKLLQDAPNLAKNLRNYLAGFSPNMREVLEKFDFDGTIAKLDEAGLLFLVMERFKNVDLHPSVIDNHTMGTVFEELIRKFNEAMNENPGEHFTPRDVVHLMVDLMLGGDDKRIRKPGVAVTVYDPCCGSGGMLTITKEHIQGSEDRPGIGPGADVFLFGQEVNPETYAVSKSDLFLNDPTGQDADRIRFGSTLSHPGHREQRFDYLITNPPYGKDWKKDEAEVTAEYEKGAAGRFAAGLPRISDGQLLFLQHMVSHMRPAKDGGSRMAIIMNGSPLFTGDAGGGESEIRRWILENDLLEALVALPEQLFYNTGIATYVWVLSNRKAPDRRRKVLLVDATSFWVPMKKSLGDKRREIPRERAAEILKLVERFEDRPHTKVFPTAHFGYRKITVERPLRLNFQASAERIARLEDESAFRNLTRSKKKGRAGEEEITEGRSTQHAVRALMGAVPQTLYKDREEFTKALGTAVKKAGVKLSAPIKKAILNALSERDDTAEICRDGEGSPEPDPELRDTENVPLSEDVDAFFQREVAPHVPDAWIDTSKRDAKDGRVGIVGYEINFNRYFYVYEPPRPLGAIEADIRGVEAEIMELLREVAG
ncbi:MAG TPA: class I SAM-dependent DNA methyltransferase [Longimicrobiales bacterium]|nr:class I SAM-dependent DNA methyltransferase [Longimicrobiales bacterium]